MKKLVEDICNELYSAVEQAMYDWYDNAHISYNVACGRIDVTIDHNDDMMVSVVHNNGAVREHSALKNAIIENMSSWCEVKDSILY